VRGFLAESVAISFPHGRFRREPTAAERFLADSVAITLLHGGFRQELGAAGDPSGILTRPGGAGSWQILSPSRSSMADFVRNSARRGIRPAS
jgi:hypothetical protein